MSTQDSGENNYAEHGCGEFDRLYNNSIHYKIFIWFNVVLLWILSFGLFIIPFIPYYNNLDEMFGCRFCRREEKIKQEQKDKEIKNQAKKQN